MKVPPFPTVKSPLKHHIWGDKSTTSPQPWPGGCSHLLVEVAHVCRARPACRPRISIPKLPISGTSIHLSYFILFYSLVYSLIYCNLFSKLISNQFYFLFYSPYLSPYAISIHTYLIHETWDSVHCTCRHSQISWRYTSQEASRRNPPHHQQLSSLL